MTYITLLVYLHVVANINGLANFNVSLTAKNDFVIFLEIILWWGGISKKCMDVLQVLPGSSR